MLHYIYGFFPANWFISGVHSSALPRVLNQELPLVSLSIEGKTRLCSSSPRRGGYLLAAFATHAPVRELSPSKFPAAAVPQLFPRFTSCGSPVSTLPVWRPAVRSAIHSPGHPLRLPAGVSFSSSSSPCCLFSVFSYPKAKHVHSPPGLYQPRRADYPEHPLVSHPFYLCKEFP